MIEKNPTHVVIDCNGVGYLVHISLHTFSLLNEAEEGIELYTHLQVKEDSHSLFGFREKSERDLFRLLISVSGVGASTARTMLSSIEPKQIMEAIASGDSATVQRIKGIGAKTAQRVILELKDKVLKVFGEGEVFASQNNTNKEEALSALETLGFARKPAEKVVERILKQTTDPTVETIIKLALKNL